MGSGLTPKKPRAKWSSESQALLNDRRPSHWADPSPKGAAGRWAGSMRKANNNIVKVWLKKNTNIYIK